MLLEKKITLIFEAKDQTPSKDSCMRRDFQKGCHKDCYIHRNNKCFTYNPDPRSWSFTIYLRTVSRKSLDNDLKHTSVCVSDLLEENGVVLWPSPPESLDLDPIKNIWGSLKQYLRNSYML